MRSLIGLLIGAVIGGVLGWSGILCTVSDQCPLTGSWYGPAIAGGLIGFFLLGGCPCCAGTCKPRTPSHHADKASDESNPPGHDRPA